ncbi:MAG: CpaF family protein [Chloroflexota bacterium]
MTAQPVQSASPPSTADLKKLKQDIVDTLARGLESEGIPPEQRSRFILQHLKSVYDQARRDLPEDLQRRVFEDVVHEMLGYGPIQPLLDDPEVTDVMVNGPESIYVEKGGQLQRTDLKFDDDAHVMRVIERIVLPLGRHVDADSPTVDARLPDGSRVNAVVRPVALDGPAITIRKFPKERLTMDDLVRFDTVTSGMAEFLRACVLARLNIVVSGGTGAGKTTLLNVLSSFIPENERILTIEDAAELQLQQQHVLRLETKSASVDGGGATTVRDLVRNALRMRPDRIVVGECRGGEALDMLQAMNTGHDGSLTTLHANSPRDALARLETLVLMAGVDLPLRVVRQQIASAVDLIVQESRLKDGARRVTAVTEVAGMEGEVIVLTDIFKFEQSGVGPDGQVLGDLKATGMRPLFSPRLEAAGLKLRADVFGATIADMINHRQRR